MELSLKAGANRRLTRSVAGGLAAHLILGLRRPDAKENAGGEVPNEPAYHHVGQKVAVKHDASKRNYRSSGIRNPSPTRVVCSDNRRYQEGERSVAGGE